MQRLPFNPWLFIAIALTLSFGPMLSFSLAIPGIAVFAAALALVIQLMWVWQATRASAAALAPAINYIERVERLSILAISGWILTWSAFALAEANYVSPLLETIIIIPSALCAFAAIVVICWSAAKTLCNAEDRGETPPVRVVGTFLLFVYLIVGAPFIYKRLKALPLSAS